MGGYSVVYDASAFRMDFAYFVPAILTVVGLFLVFVPKASETPWMPAGCQRVFSWFYLLIAGSICLIVTIGHLTSWLTYRQALVDKSYRVAEGQIQDFVPMPYSGHANESFVVDGVRFHYSDYDLTAGFNRTEAHGGPIHANSQVRLSYLCRPTEADCSAPVIIRVETR